MGVCCGASKISQSRALQVASMRRDYLYSVNELSEPQLKFLAVVYMKLQKRGGIPFTHFRALCPAFACLAAPVAHSAFRTFDLELTGKITYRGLCCVAAAYFSFSNAEKCEFIYRVFSSAKLESLEKSLWSHCAEYLKQSSESSESLGSLLTAQEFTDWALESLRTSELLMSFEILPSPQSEQQTIACTVNSQINIGDQWNLVDTR